MLAFFACMCVLMSVGFELVCASVVTVLVLVVMVSVCRCADCAGGGVCVCRCVDHAGADGADDGGGGGVSM